jgi:hypothetical protein
MAVRKRKASGEQQYTAPKPFSLTPSGDPRYPWPPMKLTGRSRSTFLSFLFAGLLAGGLAWELLERILSAFGYDLRLGVGPVGFDLSVLAVSLVVNPGTLLGAVVGIVLFRLM